MVEAIGVRSHFKSDDAPIFPGLMPGNTTQGRIEEVVIWDRSPPTVVLKVSMDDGSTGIFHLSTHQFLSLAKAIRQAERAFGS